MANTDKVVVLDSSTSFDGLLKFKAATLCIQGKFHGTIEASGSLIVDKGAVVEADHISVDSLTVYGKVVARVYAQDMIDMFSGAEVKGDVDAGRLRIADGVLFEGQCNMTRVPDDLDIFSHSLDEIKETLLAERSRIAG
jgi:cytoskeletal protein CcmA (bactofilin family)